MKDRILAFISRFHGSEYVFLHGCCYWFAYILWSEFIDELRENTIGGGHIMYEPEEGHFVFSTGDVYYDVRGDVTELYREKTLYSVQYMYNNMPEYYKNLMRDCRDFIPEEE